MARRRVFWIGLASIGVSLALVVSFASWTISPESLKPKLIAVAERATGRRLTIGGPVRVRLSLQPTITLEDVALANPPGSSRPDMLRVARVDMRLALLPLLWREVRIDRIALERPDLLLEGDHSGHANWLFGRPPPARIAPTIEAPATGVAKEEGVAPVVPPPPTGSPARTSLVQGRFAISLRDVAVEGGQAGLLDRRVGRPVIADLRKLTLTTSADGSVRASGTITFDGHEIAVAAETGSPRALSTASATTPWPVSGKLESEGATVTFDGSIAQPLLGRDYSFTLNGNLPTLAPWLPDSPLAVARDVTAHAKFADSGNRMPLISELDIKAGSADLNRISGGGIAGGDRLEDVTVTGRGAAPLAISARVGADSTITGTVGDLSWLSSGGAGPVAVDLHWNGGTAQGSVKGKIGTPRRLADFALDVTLAVPDPASLFDAVPPGLKSVALQASLTDGPGASSFRLTSSAGDLAGDLTVSRAPRLSVAGTISSRRIDLDMLHGSPATASAGSGSPAGSPPAPGPLIPDTKLPLERIRAADADLKLSLDQVRIGGADIDGIDAALTLKDGVLRLDPFTVASPGQQLNAMLEADAAEAPPQIHLTVDSPGFPLAPLLAVLGLPEAATGTVELHADLTGIGDSPHALAASLVGRAGVAVEGGQLDARMVDGWLERLRPLRIAGASDTDLRCFAVRADAKSGIVTIEPAALSTAALILEASGDVDLAHETLALRVRPRTKIGGMGIALPVRVSGPMRTPSAKVDISAKSNGGGALAGLLLGGKDVMGAAGGGDPCPDALARARAAPSGQKP